MSQQGITIVSLEGKVLDMGDLEYIQDKVLAGDYFQVSGTINAVNDTIEFIVPSGKTAFMIEAKITMNSNPGISGSSTQSNQVVADFKIDTVQKSLAKIGVIGFMTNGVREPGGAGWGSQSESRFNVLGLSLEGDGIKTIEIENIIDSGGAFAEFSGYLIDT